MTSSYLSSAWGKRDSSDDPPDEPSGDKDSSGGEELTDSAAAQRAVEVLRDLAAQSRPYPGVAWAVGVYESNGLKWFYATSNESMGYLPNGVRWDSSARPAFDLADGHDMLHWRGLENPARIMVDHFCGKRSRCPGLRLVALFSTTPLGDEVAAFTARQKVVSPPAQREPRGEERSARRIESVDVDCYDRVVERVPIQLRWSAAIELTRDALMAASADYVLEAASGVAEAQQSLKEALAALEAGRASPERLEQVRGIGDEHRGRAQACRVPDHRLEPIDPDQPLGWWGDVAPPDEAFAYLAPFWTARVADMLSVLFRLRVEDAYVTKEQLGELAYEHFFVREQIAATREILSGHFGEPE